jgi:hypothetical protein
LSELKKLKETCRGKFVLGYMDQTHYYDVFTAPSVHRKLWLVFFSLLNKHPDLIILWKPKRVDSALSFVRSIVPHIDTIIEAGRIKITAGNEVDSRAFPKTVGAVCDLVVGLGLSTAGMECQFAGTPTFHFDAAAINDNPFARDGKDLAVFTTTVSLENSIARFMETGAPSDPERFEQLYRRIDPFNDGRAGHRAGLIVSLYYEEILSGTDRASIHDSVKRRLEEKYPDMSLCGTKPFSVEAVS